MNFSKLYKNKLLIALALILIYALILRVYALGSSPLWFDETISSLASQKIAEKGFPIFDSGFFYSRALVFHYLQAFFILLFGSTDFVVRLASVLFGLGTVVLAFFICKEFNKPAGIIAALLTCFLFLEVVYSRQARFYQAFQFLFFLTLFFLYKSKTSKKYAWLASVSLIVLVQTQIAGLVLVPFFIWIFIREHKDWKLFIIPLLVGIYFGLSFLSIGTTSTGSVYAEEYTSQIFNGLRAFALISLLGMPFAYKMNKRMFYLMLLPSLIMFVGLFFVKVFALRYAYFVTLSIIFFIAVTFSYLYQNNKIIGIAILTLAIIYPSNIFFSDNYLTVVKPQAINSYSTTEPVIDYKSLSENTKDVIRNNTLVTLSSPGVEWYLKKPDYIIPFSLNGLESGYALYNGVDVYTGAEIWNNQTNFIFLEDLFAYSKLGPTQIENLNQMKNNCSLIEQLRTLRAYSCKKIQ
ncbi:MAG: glycosyltransferase family 39 protein [Nanoarchaeota archaeon]